MAVATKDPSKLTAEEREAIEAQDAHAEHALLEAEGVSDLQEDPEMLDVASGDPDVPVFVESKSQQLTFAPGGKKPTSSTLALSSAKRELEGEYRKGQLLTITVTARVRSVEFIDQVDKETDQVVGSERRHKLRTVEFTVEEA